MIGDSDRPNGIEMHQGMIDEITRSLIERLDAIGAELHKLRARHTEELHKLRARHTEELHKLTTRHVDELDDVRAQHVDEADDVRAQHVDELDEVRARHVEEVANATGAADFALAVAEIKCLRRLLI